MGFCSRLSAPLLATLLTLVGPGPIRADPPPKPAPEHAVKAEFIERFTRFVTWPSSVFPSPTSSFVVCVSGTGPLVEALERVIARGRVQDRPTRMLRVGPSDRLDPCHILYVAEVDRDLLRQILLRTRGRPILSVGDRPGLAEQGLLVNLIVDSEGFVRFEINREIATASGLKISAKLMRLARLVGAQR